MMPLTEISDLSATIGGAYPAVMDHKLRQIRRRQLSLIVLRSVMLATAALIVAMLVAVGIDRWLTLFHPLIRAALTVTALAAAGVTLLATAAGPMRRSLGLRRVAEAVDDGVPHLEQRWSTAAELAESPAGPPDAVARAMRRQVVREAVAMGRLVEPARLATPAGARRAAVGLLVSVALLALLLAADWPHSRILIQRFWSPLTAISATQVASITGDIVRPRGDAVDLEFSITGRPVGAATLLIVDDGGQTRSHELTVDAEGGRQLVYHVASLDQSFRYRLQAGDGRSDWHTAAAIDRPVLADVKLTVTAPEYVDRPVYEKRYLPLRVSAVEGSRLQLEMRPALPLRRFELLLATDPASGQSQQQTAKDHPPERLVLTADADGWYRFDADLHEDVALRPLLVSLHGLANQDRQECLIRVIPDQAPVAQIRTPDDELTVSPEQLVDITFDAHDDHGIARAELVVYQESPIEGEPATILDVQEIPLGDQQMARHVSASAQLDLSKLSVTAGANLSFAIRVADSRPAPRDAASLDRSAEQRADQTPSRAGSMTEDAVASNNTAAAPADPVTLAAAAESAAEPPSDVNPPELERAAGVSGDAQPSVARELTTGGATKGDSDEIALDEIALASDESELGGRALAESESEADETMSVAMAAAKAENSTSRGPGDDAVSQPSPEPLHPDPLPRKAGREGTIGAAARPPLQFPERLAVDAEDPTAGDSDDGKVAVGAAVPERRQSDEGAAAAAGPRSNDSGDGKVAADAQGAMPQPADERPVAADAADTNARRPGGAVVGDDGPASDTPRRLVRDDLPGQHTESKRLRLRIATLVSSTASAATDPVEQKMNIRDRVLQIDAQLQTAATDLEQIWQVASASGTAVEQVTGVAAVDRRLETISRLIAALRDESRDTRYAFVGLQMVEIGNSQITPARDRLFIVLQQPAVGAEGSLADAAHRVSRARELLAELLLRYDRAAREEELADSLEELAEMYEVYVANMQRLLRAQAQPSPNPMQRKMTVIEVDQRYLDRLKEVLEMRRDLMSEFGRMLADDPRLLSKYMDSIKRRQASLRDRLTELHQRQLEIAEELVGWRSVDPAQREAVWALAAELRLHEAAKLAGDASQLEQRFRSQFPLGVDLTLPAPAAALDLATQLAVQARAAAVKARRLLIDPSNTQLGLTPEISEMIDCLTGLAAALDPLAAEHPSEEMAEFVINRRADIAPLAQRLEGWLHTAAHLQHRRYHALAGVDQQQLTLRTEQLRIALQDVDAQLSLQSQQEMPAAVLAKAQELKQTFETITFNQIAATYALQTDQLADAQTQQTLALAGFEQAAALFDALRRMVVEELDRQPPDDPNIADLQDPTLDQILAALEREPELAALLGIPDRRTNLRVVSDWMQWSEEGGGASDEFQASVARARQRAEQQQQWAPPPSRASDEQADMTEQQWQEVADAEQAREQLQQKAEQLRAQAEDAATDAQAAEKLRQAADQLDAMRQQMEQRQIDQAQWQQMVRSDQMQALLRAAARGEPLPDSQWNQIHSSLDDGLWQVRRRTPPENYRRAIEQYQQRIRQLRGLESVGATE